MCNIVVSPRIALLGALLGADRELSALEPYTSEGESPLTHLIDGFGWASEDNSLVNLTYLEAFRLAGELIPRYHPELKPTWDWISTLIDDCMHSVQQYQALA